MASFIIVVQQLVLEQFLQKTWTAMLVFLTVFSLFCVLIIFLTQFGVCHFEQLLSNVKPTLPEVSFYKTNIVAISLKCLNKVNIN